MGLKEFIRMRRIPKTLDECFPILDKELHPDTIKEFKEMEEKDMMASTHFTLGRWLRNEWALWDNKTELHNWFKDELGIWHADDMSGIILTSYHRKLNGKDIALNEQIQFYKDWWETEGKAKKLNHVFDFNGKRVG